MRLIAFCLAASALIACTSKDWRAKAVKSVSNNSSQVHEMNSITFGNGLKASKFRLSNGLKVIVHEDHTAPVFAYHTWFNVGSRNERKGITGIAHLFEHLMFKETKGQGDGRFDRVLEEQGGRVNAATYVDWTFYRESLPKEAFALIPPIEADRMQNIILSDEQVNAEREVVANERRFRTDNSPSGSMQELLYMNAFTVHPYHWPVIGWMEDIHAISPADCIAFYKTYYSPNNAAVIVVGDVETESVLKAIQAAYGDIAPADIPTENLPTEPVQDQERRLTVKKSIATDKLLMGYKVPGALHPDYPVLEVLSSVLFNGRSSRLYRRLVTEGQIASEAGGGAAQTKYPNLYTIDVSLRGGKTAQDAEQVIDQELKRLSTEPVPATEIEKAINKLETSFWQNFSTVDFKAQAMGFYETLVGDYRELFQEVKRYRNVTPADIQRVAITYFVPSGRTVVVAHPESPTSRE